MPLNTQIVRDGKPIEVRWSDFHVTAMVYASSWDSGEGVFKDNTTPKPDTQDGITGYFISPGDSFRVCNYMYIAMTPLNDGPYILKNDYTFVDATDGEVLELKSGDTLHAWRN